MGPEAQIPLAPLPREGSVSGAQKGPRLPALQGGIVKMVVSPAEGQVMHTPPRCVA